MEGAWNLLLGIPDVPVAQLALSCSTCDLTKRSACIPEGMAVGKRLHCLREGGCPERHRPRRHEVPTRLPLRESHPCMCEAASGTWQLSCYQMQHVNRMQQETKIPSGRNCSAQKKGERKGDSKLHTDIEPRIKPTPGGRLLKYPLSAWHQDSRSFLGQCGAALPSCQPTAQTLFPVFWCQEPGCSRSLDGSAACAGTEMELHRRETPLLSSRSGSRD